MATATAALANRTVVKIHVDSNGAVQSVTPNTFEVSKGKQEEVIWVIESNQTDYFTVEFKGQSPFYESQFSSNYPVSGLVRREVLADPLKNYEYTVRAGGKTLDPVGIVKA